MRNRLSRLRVRIYALMTVAVDSGSVSMRFGRWRELRRRLLSRPLPAVGAAATGAGAMTERDAGSCEETPHHRATVVLVTGNLGTGGVETVIGMLARDLPQHGVHALVLCSEGGATADALRADSIAVHEAGDRRSALTMLSALPAGTAAQLHNAPAHLIEACRDAGVPIIPVLHTTDINLTASQWVTAGRLTEAASVSIAVSETVRAYHLRHIPQEPDSAIVVIPNGVEPMTIASNETSAARSAVESVIGQSLSDAVVFVCLARYDMQKNVPALVSAFLSAACDRPDMHLVVAGPVSDWVEYGHADALRRAHPGGIRVHLLGASAPRTLLGAADVFVLDSFFEGWAVAASEAVMAGLPVVLSDTGGAAELVGQDGHRGYLVGNPAASPESMSLESIRRSRRRTENQANRRGLIEAMQDAHSRIDDWRADRGALAAAAGRWLSREEMIASHARVIAEVVMAETV